MQPTELFEARAGYSQERLDALRDKIAHQAADLELPDMAIFCGGSYGRYEASEFSDIDLFFAYKSAHDDDPGLAAREHILFDRITSIGAEMSFPPFSNQGEYLHTHVLSDMVTELGGREDDARNYFTTRMLLLLESKPLYGDSTYAEMIAQIVDAYYRDYPGHESEFEPWFLINDVMRYWKTLLLNYENKRNRGQDAADVSARVKNFKLKFSRMTTCFATIAALGSEIESVGSDRVIELIRMTPRERLEVVAENIPPLNTDVAAILSEYGWFLTTTATSTAVLHGRFADGTGRRELFERASAYGALMYDLLVKIDADERNASRHFLRHLVV